VEHGSGGAIGESRGIRSFHPRPSRPLRSSDPGDEARKRNLILLGVVILIGFFMPIAVEAGWRETRLVFLNFLVLQGGAPGEIVLFCLYPLIAGAIVILLAMTAKGAGRSVTLLGLGILSVVLLLTLEGARGRGFVGRLLEDAPVSASASLLIGLLAAVGLFVGSRARHYRPASQAAAVIGIIGGILCLLNLVLPVLPPEAGSILLLAPFKLLEFSGAAFVGLGVLAMMGCLVAASVLCIVNVKPRRNSQMLAQVAFLLQVSGYAVYGFFMLVGIMGAGGSRGQGTALLLLIKMGCWIVGLLLLIPVGLTDLVVNLTPPGRAMAGREPRGPTAPPRGQPLGPQARLAYLKKLLDGGLLSPEEYERKRADLEQRA
jgi:hypothetical protein